MGLYSEIARLPNDHPQLRRATLMFRLTCARSPRSPDYRTLRDSDSRPRGFTSDRQSSRRGTAAVEFAFVAPVFFLLVFGLIELGRMVMVQQALTNAAREGCRTAVLATTIKSSDAEAAVRNYLNSVMSNASDIGEVRITVPPGLATATPGTSLTVTVEVDYQDVTWVPLGFLGLNPTIAARQTGRRE